MLDKENFKMIGKCIKNYVYEVFWFVYFNIAMRYYVFTSWSSLI